MCFLSTKRANNTSNDNERQQGTCIRTERSLICVVELKRNRGTETQRVAWMERTDVVDVAASQWSRPSLATGLHDSKRPCM